MHIIFFDASTLILLAKIGLLERFLGTWHGRAVVTPMVAKEAWGRKPSPEAAELARLAESGVLGLQPIKDVRSCHRLQTDFSLGPGEAEAIWAATHTSEAIVATDDRLAIRACRTLGLPWMSALAFVIRMYERGALTRELAEGFLRALGLHGRYHRQVMEDALGRLERKV